jgi:ceramide glucosyltransferase
MRSLRTAFDGLDECLLRPIPKPLESLHLIDSCHRHILTTSAGSVEERLDESMGVYWPILSLLVGLLAILRAVLAGMQTYENRRFARSRLRSLHRWGPTGHAMLFVPCRGLDLGLEENFHALFEQDHADYEICFIVESRADPACPIIERVMVQYPEVASRVLFVGPAQSSGQKVHNLRVATEHLPPGTKYLAFVDSDARPTRGWLRALLSRLDRPEAGAATGYRWFIPKKASLANHLVYSINCGIASLLGHRSPTLVWGGSWAIRRDMFQWLGIREAWNGTLSDDLVASRVLREAGLRVEFEPAAMVASPLDMSVCQMVNFVRRQYLIGRFYVPGWWAFALASVTFANLVLLGSLGLLGWCLATGSTWLSIPAGIFSVLYLADIFRGLVRQDAALAYFPHLKESLGSARRFDIFGGPLVGLVNWFLLLGSTVGRQITWRDVTYRMCRAGRIRLVRREDPIPRPEPTALESSSLAESNQKDLALTSNLD